MNQNPQFNIPKKKVGQQNSTYSQVQPVGSKGVSGGGAPGAASQASQYSRNNPEAVSQYGQKKKMGKGKKIGIGVAAALVLVLIGTGVAAALYMNSLNQALSFDDPVQEAELRGVLAPVENPSDPYYMLLLGSDARSAGESARSDVNILMRVDPENAQMTMVSIPRDTKVEIDGYGTQKINAAYAYGGPALAVQTMQQFAGVPISHYAEIRFEELERLVDTLGGVTVDVEQPINDDQLHASIPAGTQNLNGEQALIFARSRAYADGDFTRTSNQRILLTAIIQKVLSKPPTELPGAIQSLAECVDTDYTVNDVIPLAQKFQGAGDLVMYSGMVPSTTAMIDGVSYVIHDEALWNEMMSVIDSGQDPASLLGEPGFSEAA